MLDGRIMVIVLYSNFFLCCYPHLIGQNSYIPKNNPAFKQKYIDKKDSYSQLKCQYAQMNKFAFF